MDEEQLHQVQEYSSLHPLSVCTCDHTGDGANSCHLNGLTKGHGACMVKNCQCKQFTWAGWTQDAKNKLGLR